METVTSTSGKTAAMSPVLRTMDHIDVAIMFVCKLVIVATGTALLVLLTASVMSRYFFNFSLIWVGEIPEQLFPWMITAGVALAAVTNSHIAVDLLVRMFPESVRKALVVVIQLLILGTYVLLTSYALGVAEITALERSPVLKIPGSYGYYAFALGAALVAFSALTRLIRFLMTGEEPEAGTFGQEHTQ
jgi:TRAP-type C4-dicarboxylate transport system permease small subunit